MAQLPCTVYIDSEDFLDQAPPPEELRHVITSEPSVPLKRKALETLIRMVIADPSFDRMLMAVLKHLSPINDHALKKLLFIYWEVVEKSSADGKFKEEVLLCAEPLRKDLTHPNEFIRGRTLRLIARIPHLELVEPLIPAVVACLDHRFHYVRRNAVTCLFSLFSQFGASHLQSAAEPVEQLLHKEADLSTRRNAFIFLFCIDQPRALRFLFTLVSPRSDDPLAEMGGDIFQLAVIELLRKLCRADPSQKPHFLVLLQLFAQSKSPAVLLECADTLIQLSPLARDIRLAVDSYVALLGDQTDNNVRLVVLRKLETLQSSHPKLLEESVLDLLSLLRAASAFDQRRSLLLLACSLATPRNAQDIHDTLIHELAAAENLQYRELLVARVAELAMGGSPELISASVAPLVQHVLAKPDTANAIAETALGFIKRAALESEACRALAFSELVGALGGGELGKNRVVLRQAVWLVGEMAQGD